MSATFAGAQPLDRPGEAFTGTVASADAFRLVLRADNGTLVSFAIEDPAAVPAGLVPGMRITVRYEAAEGEPYRLVGVKIAAGPIEGGSTTDPPEQRSSSATVVEQPAPPLPTETTPRAATAPPQAAVAETTQASQASAEPRAAEPAQPVEAAPGPAAENALADARAARGRRSGRAAGRRWPSVMGRLRAALTWADGEMAWPA